MSLQLEYQHLALPDSHRTELIASLPEERFEAISRGSAFMGGRAARPARRALEVFQMKHPPGAQGGFHHYMQRVTARYSAPLLGIEAGPKRD